jgi:hypothetical protein
MTLVSFMCGHLHEAPSPTDKFVAENMMDSYGMLICPECKHLPVTGHDYELWCVERNGDTMCALSADHEGPHTNGIKKCK